MRRHVIRKICLFIFFFCTSMLFLSTESYASDDIITVSVEGVYDNTSKDIILERINEIRKEAYEEELQFEYDGRSFRLSPDDYHPLKWSNELEHVALLRAAEASVLRSHERPNEEDLISLIRAQGVSPSIWGESLGWNVDSDGILKGIEKFYQEKQLIRTDGNHAGEIGHYVSMIHPNLYYTALSGFKNTSMAVNGNDYSNTMWSVAQIYAGNVTEIDESKIDVSDKNYVNLEIQSDRVNTQELIIPDSISVNTSHDIDYRVGTEYHEGKRGETNYSSGNIYMPFFTSSDSSIANITGRTLTALSPGQVTITGFTSERTLPITKTILVKKPVESVSIIQPDKDILKSGETLQLEAIVEPDDATDRSIVWQTSDAQAASVDEHGMVTAISGSSTVTITAISVDNDTINDSISLKIVPQNYLSTPPTMSLLTQGDIYEGNPCTFGFNAVEGAVAYCNEIDGARYDYTPDETRQAYGFRLSSLMPGTHSIRAKAIFSDGSETDFSQPLQVTVKSKPVSGPVLTLLTSDTIYEDTGFDIRWTKVPDATYYIYSFEKVSGNSSGGGILTTSDNVLTHHFNGLPAGTGRYTLMVRAALNANGSKMSEPSNAIQVEIHPRPANTTTTESDSTSAPVLTIRSTDFITTESGITFSFTPVAKAEGYMIQIETSDEKKQLVYKSSVLNAGKYKLGPDKYEFEPGHYKIIITARLSDGSISPASNPVFFTVVNPIMVDGPTLRMKTQGTLYEDTGFELIWTAVPNATQYIVYTYDKTTGLTASYNKLDGSKNSLRINRHKAGSFYANVYAWLDEDRTTLTKYSNNIEFTVSKRPIVSENTDHTSTNSTNTSDSSNTNTNRSTDSDPPESVDNTPAPVAVSPSATVPITTVYTPLSAPSGSPDTTPTQDDAGQTQNASRAGVMAGDSGRLIALIAIFSLSLLMLRRETYQLQLSKLYHILSHELTAYQKRHDHRHTNIKF